jgi:hypothetical protein
MIESAEAAAANGYKRKKENQKEEITNVPS